jgi:hypothetical protein
MEIIDFLFTNHEDQTPEPAYALNCINLFSSNLGLYLFYLQRPGQGTCKKSISQIKHSVGILSLGF